MKHILRTVQWPQLSWCGPSFHACCTWRVLRFSHWVTRGHFLDVGVKIWRRVFDVTLKDARATPNVKTTFLCQIWENRRRENTSRLSRQLGSSVLYSTPRSEDPLVHLGWCPFMGTNWGSNSQVGEKSAITRILQIFKEWNCLTRQGDRASMVASEFQESSSDIYVKRIKRLNWLKTSEIPTWRGLNLRYEVCL